MTPLHPPSWSDVTIESEITIRDDLTNIWWSRSFGSRWYGDAERRCTDLHYNGQGGWRLPSKEALIEAYKNAISAQGKEGWITQFNDYFHSLSSVFSRKWYVNLQSGDSGYYAEYYGSVVCVRQP